MFSRRTGWVRETTALARAVERRRAAGLAMVDLTASNPTQCGLGYEAGELLKPLADARALVYEPEPFGMLRAREAVCAYYAGVPEGSSERGAGLSDPALKAGCVEPAQVCLTTGTSEGYSFLFRLLCDPGDEVLVLEPSYPLFDYLADLDDVRLLRTPLVYDPGWDHGWQLTPGGLEARVTGRTRAVALVHPNNPTGHSVSSADRAVVEELCARHGLALIVDEVFLDYPLEGVAAASFTRGPHPALTFVLSGLSTVAALPQMKGAWVVVCGPEELRREALERLELVADAFLSMNAPVQHALPEWLAGRERAAGPIRERTRGNLAQLDERLRGQTMVTRLRAEAGWYAVLRVPAVGSDDDLALALLEGWGVLVHPGHYYGFGGGFGGDGWLVVSLLPAPEEFARGIEALLACSSARAAG